MIFTAAERTELERWLANLKIEAQQLGGYLAGAAGPGEEGCRKNYARSVDRFRTVAVRVAILERVTAL